MYIIIYTNTNIKEKIKSTLMIVISFLLVLVLVSTTLRAAKITQNNLWRGTEPSITNTLKGTNIKYGGRWNPVLFEWKYLILQNNCRRFLLDSNIL